MNKDKIKKIESKISKKVIVRLDKVLSLSVFDEPRPRYIAKITFFDKIFEATILKLFPRFVRPNFLTVFRFVTIPFIIFLLLDGDYKKALWFFAISALSDALDGALARTRHQITDWGIVFDPVADKLLIGSVAFILISKFISPILAGVIIFLEIFLVIFSYWRFKGKLIPAKTVGKIKMILQSFGVSFLLLALVVNSPILVLISAGMLYLSIIFALLSLLVYRSI
jgi:CDP-diacylglycerol--glycerol-3-phosphate 3-phosphatidyltransferase